VLPLTPGRRAGAEPVAAALAYGLGRTADEALILVFDLGGGTFDCSLVEAFEGCLEARRCPPHSAIFTLPACQVRTRAARPAARAGLFQAATPRRTLCCSRLGVRHACILPPPEVLRAKVCLQYTLPYPTLHCM
jgi:hypothetical protein